jgi:hypothetical protein
LYKRMNPVFLHSSWPCEETGSSRPFNARLLRPSTERRYYLGGVFESGGGVGLGLVLSGVVLPGAAVPGVELSAGGVAVVPGAVD